MRVLAVLAVASLLLLACAGCSRTPDEQRVRDAITAGVEAAQATDARAFGKVVSEDFLGNEGELDREQLLGILRIQRLRGEKPGILMGPVSVEPRGERLVASFTVTLSSGGLPPRELGVYRVESAWRLDGGDWRCYTATWKRSL